MLPTISCNSCHAPSFDIPTLFTVPGSCWQRKRSKALKIDTSSSLGYYIEHMADTATVEVLAPAWESLIEPVAVDGIARLAPSISDHLICRVRRVSNARTLTLHIRIISPGNLDLEAATHSLRKHFERHVQLEKESMSRTRRYGLVYLCIGLFFVLVLSSIAGLIRPNVQGTMMSGLVESLVIFGWVALWKPAEMLLYDWIPIWRNIRLLNRLAAPETKILIEPAQQERKL